MSEEWVSDTAPQIPPDIKFRQELHKALEETHRQQSAQRRVGARPESHTGANARLRWLGLVATLALILAVLLFVNRQKRG